MAEINLRDLIEGNEEKGIKGFLENEDLFKKDIFGKFFPQELSEKDIKEGKIYNEFSLQHELGDFLKNELKKYPEFKDYKVQYERNVKDFFAGRTLDEDKDFIKSEMDIVIFKDFNKDSEKYAIELKFPTNNTPSKRMPHFLEDIIFMQNVRKHLHFKTYCLTLVPNNENGHSFLDDKRKGGKEFYEYFRGDLSKDPIQAIRPINPKYRTPKKIRKRGKKREYDIIDFYIEREYKPIEWKHKTNYCFYYLLEIK